MNFKNLDDLSDNPYVNMDKIFRFSNTKLIEPESDLVHTGRMIFLALFIIDDLRVYYKDENLINEENLLSRIIHHDISEAVCCDIPRSFKYHSKELHDLIESTSIELLRENGISESRIKKINEAKDDGTLEAELAAFLDMLQCLMKLRSEYQIQNNIIMKKRYLESLNNTIKNLNKRIVCKSCEVIKDRLIYYKDIITKELGSVEIK